MPILAPHRQKHPQSIHSLPQGFDLELVGAVSSAVTIPVIASSGAGAPEHFSQVGAGHQPFSAAPRLAMHAPRHGRGCGRLGLPAGRGKGAAMSP